MNGTLYEELLPIAGAVTFSAAEFIEKDQVALLRCNFKLDAAEKLPLYVSGIAGYRLYLDNEYLHCGPVKYFCANSLSRAKAVRAVYCGSRTNQTKTQRKATANEGSK